MINIEKLSISLDNQIQWIEEKKNVFVELELENSKHSKMPYMYLYVYYNVEFLAQSHNKPFHSRNMNKFDKCHSKYSSNTEDLRRRKKIKRTIVSISATCRRHPSHNSFFFSQVNDISYVLFLHSSIKKEMRWIVPTNKVENDKKETMKSSPTANLFSKTKILAKFAGKPNIYLEHVHFPN